MIDIKWDFRDQAAVLLLARTGRFNFDKQDYDLLVQAETKAGRQHLSRRKTTDGISDYDQACARDTLSTCDALAGVGSGKSEGLVADAADYDLTGFDRLAYEKLQWLAAGLVEQWGQKWGWSVDQREIYIAKRMRGASPRLQILGMDSCMLTDENLTGTDSAPGKERLAVATLWYGLLFLQGAYVGFSLGIGAAIRTWLFVLVPPIVFSIAYWSLGERSFINIEAILNRRVVRAAITLYMAFGAGFIVGNVLSGVI